VEGAGYLQTQAVGIHLKLGIILCKKKRGRGTLQLSERKLEGNKV
jgi:hypothetical protein